jgi:tRNA pseudouridine38-40 synthase
LKRIALGVQYDGAPWLGWQSQPGGGTVQDALEAALRRFGGQEMKTTCAGRTDKGVHALEQVVHFDTDIDRELYSWVRGVNSFLPRSVSVRWAHEIAPQGDEQFHARFSARARTYHYVLYNHAVRSPLLSGRAGWMFRPLDAEAMRAAAAYLIGTHDFSAFRAAECQAKSPVKSMHEITIERRGDLVVFSLRASAFLHHMVRNIVGCLVMAGTGARPPEWVEEVRAGKDRRNAAPTFMPDGLYLAKIEYDEKWALPQEEQPIFLRMG